MQQSKSIIKMQLNMKTILTTLLLGLFISLNAQETILNIKSNFSEIIGRMSNNFYKHDIPQFKNFVSILNLDVFEYYDIKSQYDTDLKRKVYIESEDYKTKYSRLQELKSQMIPTTCYLDFEPEDYERNKLVKYNLNTRNFSVSNEIYYSSYYNKLGYIQFDQILFKCPTGITVKTRNVNYECMDFIEETITFRIDDESLASKIEESRSNLRLLFVFIFTGTSSFKGNLLELTYTDYHLVTDLQKVLVYNSKTNEIYFTYK